MPPLSTILGAADAYWYVIAAIATFLIAVWKMIPVETRDAIERRAPRLVGAVRLVIAILPDLVTAGRALRIQIVEGQPKRGPVPMEFREPSRREGFVDLRVMRAMGLLFVLALAPQLFGCASNSDSLSRAVDGYSTFHVWAQRVCGVLTALPSPPVVRGFVGGDAGVALDASVP